MFIVHAGSLCVESALAVRLLSSDPNDVLFGTSLGIREQFKHTRNADSTTTLATEISREYEMDVVVANVMLFAKDSHGLMVGSLDSFTNTSTGHEVAKIMQSTRWDYSTLKLSVSMAGAGDGTGCLYATKTEDTVSVPSVIKTLLKETVVGNWYSYNWMEFVGPELMMMMADIKSDMNL